MSKKLLPHPIPYADAVAYAKEYLKNRDLLKLPPVSDGQTKWVWFSRKEIERLFAFMNENYSSNNVLEQGIKFYFGVCTKERNEPGVLYKDRLTLVMVPSIKKGDVCTDSDLISHTPSIFDNIGTMCPPRCQDDADILYKLDV